MACNCGNSRFDNDFFDFNDWDFSGGCGRDFDDRNFNEGRGRDFDDRNFNERRRRNCRRLANDVDRLICDLRRDIRRLDNAFDRLDDNDCIRGTFGNNSCRRGRRCDW